MTQFDYDKISARIMHMQMLEVRGENHSKELKKLKEKIEYFDD